MPTTNTKGSIFNIQRYSTEDGPGIRTSIFLKGCPMRCPWCHNPESVQQRAELVWHDSRCIGAEKCFQNCPNEALRPTREGIDIDRGRCDACGICCDACPTEALEILGKKYTPEEAADTVLQDKVFYDESGGGMTLTGGEPCLQPAFCIALMDAVKRRGVHIVLDTCCGVGWKTLSPLVELADLVLIDLKIMDETEHLEFTGIPLDLVLNNAVNISREGKKIWVRTPIIPGYTDSVENVRKAARFIKHNLPTVDRYDILAFNNFCSSKYSKLGLTWELKNASLIPADVMLKLADVAEKEGLPLVRWSGMTRAE